MSDTPRVDALSTQLNVELDEVISRGDNKEFARAVPKVLALMAVLACQLERELTAAREALVEAGMVVEDDASLPDLIHALTQLRDEWHNKYVRK